MRRFAAGRPVGLPCPACVQCSRGNGLRTKKCSMAQRAAACRAAPLCAALSLLAGAGQAFIPPFHSGTACKTKPPTAAVRPAKGAFLFYVRKSGRFCAAEKAANSGGFSADGVGAKAFAAFARPFAGQGCLSPCPRLLQKGVLFCRKCPALRRGCKKRGRSVT